MWNLFATSLGSATSSVVANAGLVRKVAFPARSCRLASVGAALVHFFLQAIVLVLALVVFQYEVAWSYLPLLPVALFALLFFVAALGILLGSINVYLRDTAHFVELALIAWFFMTPIVYPYETVAEKLGSSSWLYLLNPITDIVLTFQRAIYGQVSGAKTTDGVTTVTKILPEGVDQWWYLWHLGLVILASAVLFVLALVRLRPRRGQLRRGALSRCPRRSRVRGVSKHFKLAHERYSSLKERVIHFGRVPARGLLGAAGHRPRGRPTAPPPACSGTTARGSRRC